jgi:hypothetical protein
MVQPSADTSAQQRYSLRYDRPGAEVIDVAGGWLEFAVILLGIAGILNIIAGIGAIGDSKFFVHDAKYVIGNLHTWGWVVLGIGAVQILVGWGIWRRNQVARWVGVFALALNAIAQLLMIPAYPFLSLAIFALDVIAIYGLVAYGGRPRPVVN